MTPTPHPEGAPRLSREQLEEMRARLTKRSTEVLAEARECGQKMGFGMDPEEVLALLQTCDELERENERLQHLFNRTYDKAIENGRVARGLEQKVEGFKAEVAGLKRDNLRLSGLLYGKGD